MPVARGYVLVLQDGQVVIDWGEGRYQEIVRGEFLTLPESEISHAAQDTELEYLKTLGQLLSFDRSHVYFPPLPEQHR